MEDNVNAQADVADATNGTGDAGALMVEETEAEQLERVQQYVDSQAAMLTGGEFDDVDAAIDALSGLPDDEAIVTARNTRAAQLAAEVKEQVAVKKLDRPNTSKRGPGFVWTIDNMLARKPLIGDLFDDGEFLFEFMPLLDTPYCVERFEVYDKVSKWFNTPRSGEARRRVQQAYAEINFHCLRSWPVRETVQDEKGEDIWDEMEVEGDNGPETIMVLRTEPLLLTKDNVFQLPQEMQVQFIDAMTRKITGEVRGQP
jgi:hypothetical protein